MTSSQLDKNFTLSIPMAQTGTFLPDLPDTSGAENCAIFRHRMVDENPSFSFDRGKVSGPLTHCNPEYFFLDPPEEQHVLSFAAWTLSGPGYAGDTTFSTETRSSFIVSFPLGFTSNNGFETGQKFKTQEERFYNLFLGSYRPLAGSVNGSSYGGGGIPRPPDETLDQPLFGVGGLSGCAVDLLAVSVVDSLQIYKMNSNGYHQKQTTLSPLQTITHPERFLYLWPVSFNWYGTVLVVGAASSSRNQTSLSSSNIVEIFTYVAPKHSDSTVKFLPLAHSIKMSPKMQNFYQASATGDGNGVLTIGSVRNQRHSLVMSLHLYDFYGTPRQVLYHFDSSSEYFSYSDFPNLNSFHMLQFACVSRSGKNIVILKKGALSKESSPIYLEVFQFIKTAATETASGNGIISSPSTSWSSGSGFISGVWHTNTVILNTGDKADRLPVHIPRLGKDSGSANGVCGVRFLDDAGTIVGFINYNQNPPATGGGSDSIDLSSFHIPFHGLEIPLTPDTGLNGPGIGIELIDKNVP